MRQNQTQSGFTLVELLLVIAIIGMLAALLLPALNQGKAKAQRIQCVANLRQIGLGFHGFAYDHGSRFPMQVPLAEGGSQELAENGYFITGDFYFSHRHFQALSNELGVAQVLTCPADLRVAATKFALLQNSNLSYFVNVKAEYGKSDVFLAGDRNITEKWHVASTTVNIRSGSQYAWSDELHRAKGNILFADGHVDELNSVPVLAADLVLPTPMPSTVSAGSTAVSGNLPNGTSRAARTNVPAKAQRTSAGTNPPAHSAYASPVAGAGGPSEAVPTGDASMAADAAQPPPDSNAPVVARSSHEPNEEAAPTNFLSLLMKARKLAQRAAFWFYLLLLLLFAVLIYVECRRRCRKLRELRSAIAGTPD